MKIAIIGTAPSSVRLAPYTDPSWQIWACSPGTYPILPRCDAFFEIHRPEPPVIGQADKQVPWFSPEYWAWLALQKRVYMVAPQPDIPNSVRYPFEHMLNKYGRFNFTSSIAWMLALAIEEILARRDMMKKANLRPVIVNNMVQEHAEADYIGLWGVDMAATEEYGFQRSGCQFFIQMAADLDINIVLPPESDLMTPPPLYGLFESDHRAIKLTARRRELQSRLQTIEANMEGLKNESFFVKGALSDLEYMFNNWMFEGPVNGADFRTIFHGYTSPPHGQVPAPVDSHQPANQAQETSSVDVGAVADALGVIRGQQAVADDDIIKSSYKLDVVTNKEQSA
jgi:hypothetical protein